MPKSKHCGRQYFIDKARKHAAAQKNPQQAFDSFLSGINCVLEELDGKTVVKEQEPSSGDFVNQGTITGSFSWAMRGVEYEKNRHKWK